jgi:predicted nuclease of restriction endonuclease-like (RecB) superfamily
MNKKNLLNFKTLVKSIQNINTELTKRASSAVNISLTLRNWLIGGYIAEYELNGSDRAKYGDKLLSLLEKSLQHISNCNRRQLYRYLRFYRFYPQIMGTVPPQFKKALPFHSASKKVGTLSPQLRIPAKTLLSNLSYSHFDIIVDIEDETKRTFYEMECIKGTWSVRELERQIGSLYYERSGLSYNKRKLSMLTHKKSEKQQTALSVRDPFVFEFLGLKPKEVMSESHLEDQLMDKLQEFILELGHGFCFEARQKRILVGDEYFFIDLVFYHRILKCHILLELKLEKFSQENIGQLNTYVSWYHKNMMSIGDNPPIGILLCTDKKHALAEYALAGMDNHLFVSKYMLELPKKEDMQHFIETKLQEAT